MAMVSSRDGVIDGQEHSRWRAMNSDRHAIALAVDLTHELGEVCLHLGQGKHLRHGHKHD
jgi:hypothetical protein